MVLPLSWRPIWTPGLKLLGLGHVFGGAAEKLVRCLSVRRRQFPLYRSQSRLLGNDRLLVSQEVSWESVMISKNIVQGAAVAFFLGALTAPALADPDAPKTLASEVVEHNAEQIATIGDTVYYFGELGMQ